MGLSCRKGAVWMGAGSFRYTLARKATALCPGRARGIEEGGGHAACGRGEAGHPGGRHRLNERNFHGTPPTGARRTTPTSSWTKHPTLIDTCKPGFADELIERVSEIIDPSKIEYIVANHGAGPLRRAAGHPCAGTRREDLLQRPARREGPHRPLRRSGLRAGQDRRQPLHRPPHAAVHPDGHGALARQHGHLLPRGPHPVLQRRVRPTFRLVEALRRRGGPARGARSGQEVLRQHRDALLAPRRARPRRARRARHRHDRAEPRRHLAQPRGRDPRDLRALELA